MPVSNVRRPLSSFIPRQTGEEPVFMNHKQIGDMLKAIKERKAPNGLVSLEAYGAATDLLSRVRTRESLRVSEMNAYRTPPGTVIVDNCRELTELSAFVQSVDVMKLQSENAKPPSKGWLPK